jgi:hypothetical protein
MAILWNLMAPFTFLLEQVEASMVREWVEAAGFVLVVAACYMMIVPV